MPKPKRTPIDYKPQFADDIFRPKEIVEDELASLEAAPIPPPPQPTSIHKDNTNERTNKVTNVRTNERAKIRHSFDIYHDQLLSLIELQADTFRKTGRKPKVGTLVQEAIDAYIKKHKPNERTK